MKQLEMVDSTEISSLQRLASVPVKRMTLKLDGKVSYRCAEQETQFLSHENLSSFFHTAFGEMPIEEFWVVALTSSHRPICAFQLEQGVPSQAVVYPAKVMRALILANAAACVVGHNHPSGEAKPSLQDRELTRALQAAASTLQIRFLDHVITTPNGDSFSFRKEGLL